MLILAIVSCFPIAGVLFLTQEYFQTERYYKDKLRRRSIQLKGATDLLSQLYQRVYEGEGDFKCGNMPVRINKYGGLRIGPVRLSKEDAEEFIAYLSAIYTIEVE